jgi:hypothetical protein
VCTLKAPLQRSSSSSSSSSSIAVHNHVPQQLNAKKVKMALSSLSPSPIEKHNGKVVEQVHVSGNVWKLLQRSCCKSLEALVVVIGRKKKSAKLRSTQGRRVDHRPVGRKLVLTSMNPFRLLAKLRDAYVNMMNTAASSGYFDDAAMAMCRDPWQFSAAACDKDSSDQCAGDLAIVALNLLALEITSSSSSSSNIATNLEVNGAAPKLPDLGSKLTNSSNQQLHTIDVAAGSGSFVKRSVHVQRTSSLLHTSIME